MKIIAEEVLLDLGGVGDLPDVQTARQELRGAVAAVVWPVGAADFTINPTKHGNGVKPIKTEFVAYLRGKQWAIEFSRSQIGARLGEMCGDIDAAKPLSDGLYGAEWETGNISSSHRSVNKLAMGLLQDRLVAATLVVPSRELYPYLTDRIGNVTELRPYFPMWKALGIQRGFLSIMVVEHDQEDDGAPLIPKGKDGRAKEGAERLAREALEKAKRSPGGGR